MKLDAPVDFKDGDVARLTFSPDGKILAAVLADKVIRLWDVATGKERDPLKGHGGDHGGKVLALAFAPDSKTLASGGMDNTVRLWEVASGKELRRMTGHQSWVQAVTFAPDGRTLASGSQDHTIRRWDVATGKEVAPLGGHNFWVFTTAAFARRQAPGDPGPVMAPSASGSGIPEKSCGRSRRSTAGSTPSPFPRMVRLWFPEAGTRQFVCGTWPPARNCADLRVTEDT